MTSLDRLALNEEGTPILDCISETQNLTYSSGEKQTFNYDYCHGIMDNLGIDKEMQQLIMSYAKSGNIDSALYSFKVRNKTESRKAIRKNIAMIKEYVGAQ
jgi:hypothetical protein